jgi:F-type H+-transporting ATPase subunit b
MKWNFFSLLLSSLSFLSSSEESFLEFNSNILETNVINILLLLGILFYAYQNSFRKSLEERQQSIIQVIENSQTDLLKASNAYKQAEKTFSQSFFWLQTWKQQYQEEKKQVVTTKYKQVKLSLLETFLTTESLLQTFEKKTFFSLKRYVLLLTASQVIRKFIALPKNKKQKQFSFIVAKYAQAYELMSQIEGVEKV